MEYTITIPQPHLQSLINLLETVPAPMNQTLPIHQNLVRQKMEQDAANAIQVPGVFFEKDNMAESPEG